MCMYMYMYVYVYMYIYMAFAGLLPQRPGGGLLRGEDTTVLQCEVTLCYGV